MTQLKQIIQLLIIIYYVILYAYILHYGRSVNRSKRISDRIILLQQHYLALSFDNKVC